MEEEEVQKAIDELTSLGATDEEILEVLDQRFPNRGVAKEPVVPTEPVEKQGFWGSLGKSIAGFVGDVLPATHATTKAATAETSGKYIPAEELKRASRDLMFKRFSDGDILGGLSVGDEDAKQYITEQTNLPQEIKNRELAKKQRYLQEAAKQRGEFEEYTKDVTKTLSSISKPSDVLGYVGYTVGQTLPQVGLALLTGTSSSYFQEAAEIYDSQLRKLSEDTGQSIEELVAEGKDDPTAGIGAAMVAAGLDRVGLEAILKNFGKDAIKHIIRSGSKLQAAKAIGINFLKTGGTEALTETGQYGVEEIGSSLAAGRSLGRAIDDLDPQAALESAAAGFVGGGILGAGGTTISSARALNKAKKLALINETVDKTLQADTPEAQAAVDEINKTTQLAVIDVAATTANPNPTQRVESKLEDVQGQLDADNLARAEGKEGLLPATRQQLEDEANRLQGKPTDAEKEAEKEANKTEGGKKKPSEKIIEAGDFSEAEQTSPEYNKAVEEFKKMLDLFAERAANDPTANHEAEYAQLLQAKEAVRKLAPKGVDPNTGTKQRATKTPIQELIERVTGILKPPPKTETLKSSMKPTALNQQQKDIAEGVRRGAKGKNALVQKVQDALKEFNLTPRQINVIMTKIRGTNLFTAGSVSRLSSLIRKVSADSVYADKLSEAQTLRTQLKKGRKTQSHTERSALKEFAKINPSRVEDIDAYLKQAKSMVERLGRAQDLRSIAEYVGPQLATAEAEQQERDQERAEALAEDLDITLEEAAEMLFGDKETDNKEKNAAMRAALMAEAEMTKNHLFNAWDEGEIEVDSKHHKADVEALKKMDLSLLNNKQLQEFIRVTDRIATNEDWGGVGRMTAISDAQQNFKELEKVAKGFSILNLNFFEKNLNSLPLAMQAITGLPKDAALFQLYMGFKGVADASNRTIAAEEKFIKGINELKKTNPEAFENDNIMQQGIYAELIRYNEDADPLEALEQNKKAIESTIATLVAHGETKEAAKVAELYAPFKGVMTVDEAADVMSKVNKGGKKVVDYMIEAFSPYAQEVVDYRDRYFNKKTGKVVNYSGPRVWSKDSNVKSEEEFNTLSQDSEPSAKRRISSPKEISQAKEFTGATKEGGILNFNKHFNSIRGLRDTIFAIEAMPSMLQVREMIADREGMERILGAKADNPDSVKKARDLFDKLFSRKEGVYFDFEDHAAARKIPEEFDRKIGKSLNILRKIGYVLSLSGISQIPKQMTVLSNVAINLGSDADLLEMFPDKKELTDMLEGETVSLRGAQRSEFSLGEIAGTSRAQEFENWFDRNVTTSFEGWLGIKPMVKTDAKVAQLTWLAFYKQYLRQNDVKYEGLKKENTMRDDKIRKEARAYAKQRVDTLQVVSNPAELGKQIKNQGAFAQLVKAFLIPYGTFSSNAKSRMWADWRAIATGNAEQRGKASRDMVATLAEQLTFHSISAALKIYLWSNVGQLVAGMFDLPEDKDRKEKDWESAVKVWKTRLIMDLLPIILTDPGEKGIIETVNYASDRLIGYKDPLYRFKPGDRPWANLAEIAGPYGVPFERAWSTVEAANEAVTGTRRKGDKSEKLTPEQQRMAMLVAVLYGLHVNGKMPADVIYAIDKERRLQKPGRRVQQPIEYIK